MPAYRVLAAALFLFSCHGTAGEAAQAADFRVDNTVFVEGQSQPQSQGVTIFHEGLVYDFLNEPAEVIVFDKAQRRFILLDIGRHVRSEISIDDVQASSIESSNACPVIPIRTSNGWPIRRSKNRSTAETSQLTLKSP